VVLDLSLALDISIIVPHHPGKDVALLSVGVNRASPGTAEVSGTTLKTGGIRRKCACKRLRTPALAFSLPLEITKASLGQEMGVFLGECVQPQGRTKHSAHGAFPCNGPVRAPYSKVKVGSLHHTHGDSK
jgi:hypothetical protein